MAGYSVERVAGAVHGFPRVQIFHGDESVVWREWVEAFDSLTKDEDEPIRRIGEAGKENAEAQIRLCSERERQEKYFWHRLIEDSNRICTMISVATHF